MEQNVYWQRIQENKKHLTNIDKQEIKKAFDFFDTSGSGEIQVSSLKVVLQALGYTATLIEIFQILKLLGFQQDQIEKSNIDFQTFLNVILYKMSEDQTEENIQKAFQLFAETQPDGEMLISKDSLKLVNQRLNQNIKEEEIEELILLAVNKKLLENCGQIRTDSQDIRTDFNDRRFKLNLKQFKSIFNEH